MGLARGLTRFPTAETVGYYRVVPFGTQTKFSDSSSQRDGMDLAHRFNGENGNDRAAESRRDG